MSLKFLAETFAANKLTRAASFVTATAVLVGSLWAIDSHYAKAADVESSVRNLAINQQSMSLDLRVQLNKQSLRDLSSRLEDLEDKIAVSKKADPVDLLRQKRLTDKISDLKTETTELEKEKLRVERLKK